MITPILCFCLYAPHDLDKVKINTYFTSRYSVNSLPTALAEITQAMANQSG
jgi:hypothetical protein